jgi:uncharacterized RDD family membrane protein YckC
MTNGMTTSGLTNRPTNGDLAVQPLLCAAEAAPASVYPSADSWRVEVAARLERYRTRRKPRTPRYPSLLLPFDSPANWSRPAQLAGWAEARSGESGAAAATAERAVQDSTLESKEEQTTLAAPASAEPRQTPELSAKVIEFPRSAAIPVFHRSELADPIFDFDRPRIVEAPEILPPPPALGGMLIEPAPHESTDKRADCPSAIRSASIGRRLLAVLIDGLIVATALTAFAAIFLRVNPSLKLVRGPLPLLAVALGVFGVLLWAAYEFFFVVYTGSTPGLRAARLRLAAFEGSPLNRRTRRWRVLASLLSVFSAGLGYLWCVLDQDGLCWHDRITRSHVQSAAQPE